MELPYDPAIPLLGIYLKKPKTLIWKNKFTTMFIAVLFSITKIWKQPYCLLINQGIKQLWDIYTMEFYSATKKEKILSFAIIWMDLENIILSNINQSEKDKYHMILLICGVSWTDWISKQNRDRLIDRKQMTSLGSWGLGVEGLSNQAKRKKDSWTWTTVWWLQGAGGIRKVNGNGEENKKRKWKKWTHSSG